MNEPREREREREREKERKSERDIDFFHWERTMWNILKTSFILENILK
jgi:hypothetical protein